MKKSLFIFLLLFLPLCNFAQDTIFKRNSEKIAAKVLEVSPDEIKYKKFILPEGPTYIEKKSGIRMIIYSNGTKELFDAEIPKKPAPEPETDYYSKSSFKPDKIEDLRSRYRYKNRTIGQKEMQKIVISTNDKEIKSLIMQSRESKKIQIGCGFSTIPFGIATMYSLAFATGGQNETTALAVAGICLAGTIACPIISGVHKRKKEGYNSRAIAIYNQKF